MSLLSCDFQPAARFALVYFNGGTMIRPRSGHTQRVTPTVMEVCAMLKLKRIAACMTVFAMALLVPAALSGCDREVAHEKSVDIKDDGTVKTKEKTITKDADGGTTITEEKTTERP
jgi:hypothetical protein